MCTKSEGKKTIRQKRFKYQMKTIACAASVFMLSVLFGWYRRKKCVKIHRFQSIGLDFVVFITTFSYSFFQVIFSTLSKRRWQNIVMRTSGNQSSWIVKSRKKISSFWFWFFRAFTSVTLVYFTVSISQVYAFVWSLFTYAIFFILFFTWRQKTYDSIKSFLCVLLLDIPFYVFLRINDESILWWWYHYITSATAATDIIVYKCI